MKWILPLLLGLSLFASASAEEYSAYGPNSRVHRVQLHPQFRGLDGREYREPRLPTELTYFFRMKPGHLYPGPARKSPQNSFELEWVHGNRDSFVVTPDQWLKRLSDLAQPLNAWYTRKGLSVEPAETRMAVTHVEVYDVRMRDHLGDYATVRSSGHDGWLLYVDRPCRISGALGVKNGSLTYDVTLAARGVHQLIALRASESSRERRVVAAEAEADLDLVIAY